MESRPRPGPRLTVPFPALLAALVVVQLVIFAAFALLTSPAPA